MLRYALLDPMNDKFIFFRTLTLPIQPFNKCYESLSQINKSILYSLPDIERFPHYNYLKKEFMSKDIIKHMPMPIFTRDHV